MRSKMHRPERGLRRKLLGSASALALLGLCQFPGQALAGDNGEADFHLTLDVGGQFTMTDGGRTIYGDASSIVPPPSVGTNSGGDGFVGLNLERNGWVYGLSFNFGRTGTSHAGFSYYTSTSSGYYSGTAQVRHNESHKIIDFTIGKDVGLGMFGLEGSSVLSGGIEWANFSATTVGDFSYASKYDGSYYTNFSRVIRRRFNGIGPVVTWNAWTPLGDPGCHLTLNWGATAAVLFGPRKGDAVHSSSGVTSRSRSATVPRASGYLGVGWHPEGSPLSLNAGYAVSAAWRVLDSDFHDTGNTVDRIIHGPYVDLTLKLR